MQQALPPLATCALISVDMWLLVREIRNEISIVIRTSHARFSSETLNP
jgi:two-component SAPR family response regulator